MLLNSGASTPATQPAAALRAPDPHAVAREVQYLELVERLKASPFLSYRREGKRLEREHARVQGLPASRRSEAEHAAKEAARASASMWKGDVEPIPFDEFCFRLDGSPLTERQLKAFADTDLLRARDWFKKGRQVQEFVLIWGKGSGKGYVGCKAIAYATYLVLHIKGDPATFFGLAASTKLAVMNVAPTEHQAKTVVFEQLRRFVGSRLFRRFLKAPKKQILSDEIRFTRRADNGLDYPYLTLFSRHSRSVGIEGHNLLAWVMDEADEFLDKAEKSNAEAVHSILRSSCNTRVGDSWLGFVISYPRTEDGFMMRWYRETEKEATFYRDLAATWEVRPSFSKNQEGVQFEYRQNPRLAAAKYECRPMPAAGAFFEYSEKIDEAVDPATVPVATWRQKTITRRAIVNGEETNVEFVAVELESITPRPGHRYYIGVDGGVKKDSFVLSVWHVDATGDAPAWLCPTCARNTPLATRAPYTELPPELARVSEHLDPVTRESPRCGGCLLRPHDSNAFGIMMGWLRRAPAPLGVLMAGGKEFRIPRVVEDLLIEVRPDPPGLNGAGPAGRTVCFVTMAQVLVDLVRGLGGHATVRRVRCDPWQTVQLRQEVLSATSCDVDEISFQNGEQYRRATLAKALLYNHLIAFSPDDGRDIEWRRLEDVGGRKVDHPEGGSKDKFDAEAIAIWCAVDDRCADLTLSWA